MLILEGDLESLRWDSCLFKGCTMGTNDKVYHERKIAPRYNESYKVVKRIRL
jgi:hypothetical protein